MSTSEKLPGNYLESAAPPPDGEFHIGLVMAGAVSAGAFTAGVIDFLIEALDTWEEAKQRERSLGKDPKDWLIPGHQVKLRIMAGASAGSITAAIAAPALKYGFPHVSSKAPYVGDPNHSSSKNNPLYKAWVKDVDIRFLLGDKDLPQKAPVKSILDSTVLDTIGASAISYDGPPSPDRPYLASPMRFVFTIANMRGTPYFMTLRGNGRDGLGMVAHADYVSYSVSYGDQQVIPIYKDDRKLTFPNLATDPSWLALAQSALGSAAFPLGLAARPHERDAADYDFRFVLVPPYGGSAATIKQLLPKWNDGKTPNNYRTMVVDGGTMNNEPVELARVELSGLSQQNPRDGDKADRAILMIDPFPDKSNTMDDVDRGQKGDILHTAMSLLDAWKDQARFKPIDIALAEDKGTYSRFLISPSRDGSQASKGFDIACGALGGFSGFLEESYRHHDYLLGRRNCQRFLAKHFCLPVNNAKLFGKIPLGLKTAGSPWLIDDDGEPSLPIIPLIGNMQDEEPLPDWPTSSIDLDNLGEAIDDRFSKVIQRLLETTVSLNFFEEFGAELGLRAVRKKLVKTCIDKIESELNGRNLHTVRT